VRPMHLSVEHLHEATNFVSGSLCYGYSCEWFPCLDATTTTANYDEYGDGSTIVHPGTYSGRLH